MAKKTLVETNINGEVVEFLCEPRQSLLECLRDVLELTGSKEGCLTGDCGACSVLVDGRAVCSCLMLGVEAQGKNIRTIEGLADGATLHPLQQKFLEHASLQCGICTPGFLMSATALLERKDLADGEADLAAKLKTQNQTFIDPDRESFKAVVRQAGLYQQWRDAYGEEAFGLLEKSVGKLA